MNQHNKYDKMFWQELDKLLQSSIVIIDRPKGSVHPKFPDFVYPVDYGYLKNTNSMDGGGIDVWVGTQKIKKIDSILCIVDTLKRDSEIKILYGCTSFEKELIYNILNKGFIRAIMICR